MKKDHAYILEHWKKRGDVSALDARLEARGIPTDNPPIESLASEDQLHVGGLDALRLFADWVGLEAGSKVLDLGAGLGGPARWLASERGVEVTAVELSPELSAAAVDLTGRCGLSDRITHVCADVVEFEESEQFDLVWLQHVDMHVAEKAALYDTARNALTEGGRVVWHDWLAGPGGEPRWPLFWSADGSGSCVVSEERFRETVGEAGLELTRLEDVSEPAAQWLGRTRAAAERSLGKARSDASRARQNNLLEETRNALECLAENRLVQFFAEARPR